MSTKLVTWNQTKDCCKWSGIQCNNTNGRVIGLDLSNEAITRGIDNLSPLFHLKKLQTLNLAYNPVIGYIPSAIGNLSSLTYLNLSHTSFKGQLPLEISQLFNLVILDLSMQVYPTISSLVIRNPNLETIFRNLTYVRELYLDGIAILAKGGKWGEQISSSLPRLQVLSMAGCNLTGGIHHSVAKLSSLSVISLDFNNLADQVPGFLAGFTNLTVLTMNNCGLTGTFPKTIFEVPTLTTLYVAANRALQGSLPDSISKSLKTLVVADCNFQGIIPPSIGNLRELETLIIFNNNLSGMIPSFSEAKNLVLLDVSSNSLSGRIPSSLFSLDSNVKDLSLGFNSFEGPIPESIFRLSSLQYLDLSWNRFNGTLKLHELLPQLPNLGSLQLSHNNFRIDIKGIAVNTSLPLLGSLGLASSNLHAIPELIQNQPYLWDIDLSNNQLQGSIPEWIWYYDLYSLNLSHNNFLDLKIPLSAKLSSLRTLDLNSNILQGQLPSLPSVALLEHLNLSNNSFVTTMNHDFGHFLSSAQFISLAGNNIYGSIPESLCNASILQVLDLSDNDLNGTIPVCLIKMTQSLAVLNLRGNALHGAIPDEFRENCTLETLNLNMNVLHGKLPGSLAKCKSLKVLDLGNNRLRDTFPCHLQSISSLQVLVLRSNQLHGNVVCPISNSLWPLLQIIDLALNHFSGQPSKLFFGKSMMATTNGTKSNVNSVQYYNKSTVFQYYRDEVTVTYKGSEFQLQKILTIFTSIDLSSNDFHGNLPKELGNMNALKVLNLSHNALSGEIPRSIGNLNQLESLDLCCNSLTGNIPQQLASLSFLGYLNLSFNSLVGQIPTSTQLQSFDPSSYEGNPGLYTVPITTAGKNRHGSQFGSPHWSHKSEITWMLSGAAVGYTLGITVFFGPLLCIKRLRDWYNYHADRLLMKVMPCEKRTRSKKTSKKQTQTQRM